MAIYVTGDIHGSLSINRLSHHRWALGHNLTKDDYVIILGDFGLVWHTPPTNEEIYWLKWLQGAPWTTLFIDGNHENHELLAKLHDRTMFGGTVGKVCNSVYHLRRGQIYTIDGKSIFTFGGALSIDKASRTIGKTWWPGEMPTHTEMDKGLRVLESHHNKVDYILTHTCPAHDANAILTWFSVTNGVSPRLLEDGKEKDPTCQYFQHIADTTEYNMWCCGHWHMDFQFKKTCFVYEKVLELT